LKDYIVIVHALAVKITTSVGTFVNAQQNMYC